MPLHRQAKQRTGAALGTALAVAVLAAIAPRPAKAFFCFGFSMGTDGPSFRFGMGEPGYFRVLNYGPPTYQPTSYVIPWNGSPYGAGAPPPQFMAPSPYAAPGGYGPWGGGPGESWPGSAWPFSGWPASGWPAAGWPGGFGPTAPWSGGGLVPAYTPGGFMPWGLPIGW